MKDKKAQKTENLIAVDAGKLASSLQAVFQGVADVFGSIACDGHVAEELAGIRVQVTAADTAAGSASATDGRTGKTAKADSNPVGKEKGSTDGKGDSDAGVSGAAGAEGKQAAGQPQGADVGVLDGDDAGVAGGADAGAPAEVITASSGTEKNTGMVKGADAAPIVSADDITKVIVKKIEQNRANSAKIGALLNTYGAAKVSALDPSKYEAFLTDISQL